MESKPKNVMVVGMPRSGTSMTAGIFAREGYFVAPDPSSELREGDAHNPGGYWEAEPVIEANVRLFRAIGYEHHNTWLFDPIQPGAAEAMAEVEPPAENREVLREYDRHRPWLWKDPRLCYTLGHWWPLMDPAETSVLFLKRSPESIHRSFLRLGWRGESEADMQDVYRRVDDHLAAARWAIDTFRIPCAEIDYEDFAARPAEVAAQLSETFGLELTAADLGYSDTLNRSSLRGWATERTREAVRAIPSPVKRAVRRFVPDGVLRTLFPERYRS